jgi:hypothetical protein
MEAPAKHLVQQHTRHAAGGPACVVVALYVDHQRFEQFRAAGM